MSIFSVGSGICRFSFSSSKTLIMFYGVARGRVPGVYDTWDACKSNINGFSKALYKSFQTREEAFKFIESNSSPAPSTVAKNQYPSNIVEVVDLRSDDNSSKRTMRPKSPARDWCLRPVRVPRVSVASSSASTVRLIASSSSIRVPAETVSSSHDSFDFASFAQRLTNLENTFKEKMRALEERIEALESAQLLSMSNDDDFIEELSATGSFNAPSSHNDDASSSHNNHASSSHNNHASCSYNAPSTSSVSAPKRTLPYDDLKETKKKRKTSGKVIISNYEFDVDEDGYVKIYTDGACSNNGRFNGKAGVGVWFGGGHPLNISEPVQGRATNNMAEIQAATWALQQAIRHGIKKICIFTDSQFTINCITTWINKWKKNGWKTGKEGHVINKEELEELDRVRNYPGVDVKWEYVKGHRGILGNEMADQLARDGARAYKRSSTVTQRHPWQTYFS